MIKNLILYDKTGKVVNSSLDVQGTIGEVMINNLIPETEYTQGEYFISWEVDGKIFPKTPVPGFTTLKNMREKIIVVYFSDLTQEQLGNLKGDNAYRVALDNGFNGTQEEWLESLKGEPGKPGEPGKQGEPGEDGFGVDGASAYELALENGFVGNIEDYLESLNGEDGVDGDSAYEVALGNGFEGSEAEWLKTLKGEPGEDGITEDEIGSLITSTVDGSSFYTNIVSKGAKGNGSTNNTELFNTFTSDKTYYVPSGKYVTTNLPNGNFFGEGSILFEDEEIPLSKNVPQKVRVNMSKSQKERYQSFIAGQDAGISLNENTYGVTAIGYKVLKNSTKGRRLTSVGKGSMSNLQAGYSSVALGADALGQGTYSQRNVALGDNALKWGGTTDAITTLHDFWLKAGQENFINSNFLSKYPNVWSLLGSETTPDTSLYPTSDEDYVENTAVGRNALLHQMKGYANTAVGYNSQAHTMLGNQNTSMGNRSLRDNLGGSRNSAFGNESMSSNLTGQDNTAVGANTLKNMLHAINNVAIGFGAMYNFTDDGNLNTSETKTKGQRNTAVGSQAMQDGKNASHTTFIGTYAGQNIQGDWNVGIGAYAMYLMTTGKSNVGVGSYSNRAVITGSNNVSVGYSAGPGGDYSNTVSLGHNVHAKGSNQIQIGDDSHTVFTSQAIQTNSDKRLKNNINSTKLGLEFIKSLKPVDYKFNNSDVQRHGFIAQDLAEHENFGGVMVNGEGTEEETYSVAYSELIAPMVKAMQEQQVLIEEMQKEIKELQEQLNK